MTRVSLKTSRSPGVSSAGQVAEHAVHRRARRGRRAGARRCARPPGAGRSARAAARSRSRSQCREAWRGMEAGPACAAGRDCSMRVERQSRAGVRGGGLRRRAGRVGAVPGQRRQHADRHDGEPRGGNTGHEAHGEAGRRADRARLCRPATRCARARARAGRAKVRARVARPTPRIARQMSRRRAARRESAAWPTPRRRRTKSPRPQRAMEKLGLRARHRPRAAPAAALRGRDPPRRRSPRCATATRRRSRAW